MSNPDNQKALLWFLGAVLLIAIAGPAPNISTLLLVIIIVYVLLKNWSVYAQFLNIKGGSSS
jgi:hypothetical protein